MSELEALLAEMVRIDSTNPGLAGGPGEGAFAAWFARRLEGLGMEVDVWDVLPGRPNVVGRLPGSGDGPSLMLLGHLDVVGPWGPEAFEPVVRDGRMYGRGAADMKSGFAAMLLAAEALLAGGVRLRGDLLLAGVIDEEWESAGAEALPARHCPDACILVECTGLDVVTEHGGFAWYEVESHGVEAAGADPEHGVDAIALLAPVLAGISALDAELARRPHAAYGRGSIHASTIEGGTQLPAYPARCTLGVERCTIAGETVAQSLAEMEALLEAARFADPRFSAELRTVVAREADGDGARRAGDQGCGCGGRRRPRPAGGALRRHRRPRRRPPCPGATAPTASAASTESAAPAQTRKPSGSPSAAASSGRSGRVSAEGTTVRQARPPGAAAGRRDAGHRREVRQPRARLQPVAAVAGRRARVGEHLAGEPGEEVVLGAQEGRRARGPRRIVPLHPGEHRQQVAAVKRLSGLLVGPLGRRPARRSPQLRRGRGSPPR